MATKDDRLDWNVRRTEAPRIVQTDGRGEPQVRDLLKQLASDGGDLLKNELALAKLEMRDMARDVSVQSAKLVAAIAVAMTGALALLAAVIIGLGNLLDGAYGWAALIVGVVMLIIGGILAKAGMAGLHDVSPKPTQTVRSLKRDKQWAAREAREFKEEVTS